MSSTTATAAPTTASIALSTWNIDPAHSAAEFKVRHIFKSTSIRSLGDRDYEVSGDLTIRGITKSVTLSVDDVSAPSKDPWGNQRIGLSACAKVNRKEFGY
jgi:polyisoprenoid-binding protein YceI